MAGRGQRFVESGYDKPKPMIDVVGVPMIKRVIDSLTSKHSQCNFIFIAFGLCNLIVGSDPISYNCLFAKGMQTASFFIIGIRHKLFGFRSDFIG
jgi:hypothetical protein